MLELLVMLRISSTRSLFAMLAALAGCSCARAPGTPPSSVTETDRAFSEYVIGLRKSVAVAREQLDSTVAQLDKMLHGNPPSSTAQTNQMVNRIDKLDSTYRSRLADFSWAIRSSNLSAAVPSTAHAPFETPASPLLQAFADGEDFMLQSPMVFTAGKNKSLIVIVPRGFVTDYASIPRPLRLLFPRNGDYGIAAVVHDYLYWRQDCTRSQSDNIMAIGMREAGVPESTLRAIHVGVRLGGQGGWDNNRRDRESGLVRTVGTPFDQIPPGATWATYRQWLRAHHESAGIEYAVSPKVCAMGDSVQLWD